MLIDEAADSVELPFVMGVLADLLGQTSQPTEPVNDRQFVAFDARSFDRHLKKMAPRVAFQVPNTLIGEGNLSVDISFASLDDFSPAAVTRCVGALGALADELDQLSWLSRFLEGKDELAELLGGLLNDPALLKALVSAPTPEEPAENIPVNLYFQTNHDHAPGGPGEAGGSDKVFNVLNLSHEQKASLNASFATLAKHALGSAMYRSDDVQGAIDATIADIEEAIAIQVESIVNRPDFRELASSWHGLHHLVQSAEADERLEVRVLSIRKKELGKTLKRFKGAAWDQSPLFKRLYEDEFGTLGGIPFACLVCAFDFDHSPPDVEILDGMAQICAAVHALLLADAAPSLFSIAEWSELDPSMQPERVFQSVDYAAWNSLRACEDARYVCLSFPHFKVGRLQGESSEKYETGRHGDRGAIVHACFAMAAQIVAGYRESPWLPLRWRTNEAATGSMTPVVTPVVSFEQHAHLLAHDAGVECAGRNATVPGVHFGDPLMLHKAAPDAAAPSLEQILCTSRFAHYLKVIQRDHVEPGADLDRVQQRLSRWIGRYVLPEDAPADEPVTIYPLSDARIKVEPVEGAVGYYSAKLSLTPRPRSPNDRDLSPPEELDSQAESEERVVLSYPIQIGSMERSIELPFVIGVLADLYGSQAISPLPLADRRFVEIDVDNFDGRMKAMKPRVCFDVLAGDGESLGVDITFECLEDFTPSNVARKVEPLDQLLNARQHLANLKAYMVVRRERRTWMDAQFADPDRLFAALAAEGEPAIIEELAQLMTGARALWRENVDEALRSLLPWLMREPELNTGACLTTIESVTQRIDALLTTKLNPIIHHPEFLRLEGNWRGLWHLVSRADTSEKLKIRVLPISRSELSHQVKLSAGGDVRESFLFQRLYANELYFLGGEPFSCVVADFYFDHSAESHRLLTGLAQLADTAHIVFIGGAAPSAMNMETWSELRNPRDLARIFATPEYDAWNALRDKMAAGKLCITLPRFLARPRYCAEAGNPTEMRFHEAVGSNESDTRVWANSAYLLAVNIARAMRRYGWPARITGPRTHIRIGHPNDDAQREDAESGEGRTTEIVISDRRARELMQLGLTPACQVKNSDSIVFPFAMSLRRPSEWDALEATAHDAIQAQLPYALVLCRLLQYLNCILRDGFDNDLADAARQWLRQYVATPGLDAERRPARYPLRDATVEITPAPDSSAYSVRLKATPHYQLEPTLLECETLFPRPEGPHQ